MKKLFSIFATLAVLTVLVSAIAIFSLRWTVETKDRVIERYADIEVRIERLVALSERRARRLRAYLLTGQPDALQARAEAFGEFQAVLAEVEARLEFPESQRLLQAVEEANVEVLRVVNQLVDLQAGGASDEDIDRVFLDRLQPLREDLDDALAALTREVRYFTGEEIRRANRRVANAAALLGSTVALALLSAALLGLSLYRTARELAAEQDALDRAARFQEQVMGIVGHDIRSPLSAIIATVPVLEGTVTSAEDKKRIKRVMRSAQRIDSLAAVLLDFARLQTGGPLPMIPQEADFHELVAMKLAEVQQMHPARAIEHAASGDGLASFDWNRLGEAVRILIEQLASLASPGATVHVHTRGQGTTMVMEAAAKGPPIADVLLALMFEPSAPTEGEQQVVLSRGFSLYLARELVTSHRGTVDVRSDEMERLVFRVHIPSKIPALPPQPPDFKAGHGGSLAKRLQARRRAAERKNWLRLQKSLTIPAPTRFSI